MSLSVKIRLFLCYLFDLRCLRTHHVLRLLVRRECLCLESVELRDTFVPVFPWRHAALSDLYLQLA